jgi:hypothetical protein
MPAASSLGRVNQPAPTEAAPADSGSEPAPAPPPPVPQAPASAELQYQVTATDPRMEPARHMYGSGALHWNLQDQGHYQMDLSADVNMLVTSVVVLSSHSEGALTQQGLAPVRFSETTRNHEPQKVDLPPDAGMQDRLSVLVQIGALVLGDPHLMQDGARFSMTVADPKGRAQNWAFTVLGGETIASGIGPLATLHVRRDMEPGSNDRGIDLWIATERGGFPAKVRYTEPNSTYIDLVLAHLH